MPEIRFKVQEVKGLRNARGQFTSAVSEQRKLNTDLALATQGRVAQLMRNRIAFGDRASASTGRLLNVTSNPKNVVVENFAFGVGIPRYLDGSVAKYWRTFEEGSAAVWRRPFIGTQLMPVGGRGDGRPSPHGVRPGVRTATGELPFLDGRYIVKREIAPAMIYRQVFNEGLVQRDAVFAAVKFLNRVLGAQIKPGGGFLGPGGSIG